MIRIGTTGWSLPTQWQDHFPDGKSHLHRYAQVFRGVEISRTFRKTPQASTFERWAGSVPETFRFAVKLPSEITHDRRLEDAEGPLEEFLDVVEHLGDRLGPLLVQLPPSLEFDVEVADAFLRTLRTRHGGGVALEGRHPSWFGPEADELFRTHLVSRVAADPPRADSDGRPGGFRTLAYFRLHGSPETYYSDYRTDGLEDWAGRIRRALAEAHELWCIFDNTAAGESTPDALELLKRLGDGRGV